MIAPEGGPPPEPTADALVGTSPRIRARRLWLATRPAFLPASVAPVLIGSAWGYRASGRFDWLFFLLAILATLATHLACNVLNDVGDDLTGADRNNDERIFPYTGGSRFIQNGVMSAREMTVWGVTLLGVGALLGLALTELRGTGVLVFGLIGVSLGVLYSLPRLQLAAHGLGEAAIAAAFGVLPVTGAAWVQSGRVDGASVLISVPVSMWVAAILLMNEVPDRDADARASKRTLVVRLSTTATRRLYLALQVIACAAFVAAGALRLVPWWWPAVSLGLLVPAWRASRAIRKPFTRASLERSIKTTLGLHTAGAALVLWAVLMSAFHTWR